LREPYSTSNTSAGRAASLERNVRLLAVMNLMHQHWELYNGHWYRLFEHELMWIPAENFCRELGGHLTSVSNSGVRMPFDRSF